MENTTILLPARYNLTHKLIYIGGNFWQLVFDKKSTGTYRMIGTPPSNIKAVDPEGGPMLSVGDIIDGYTIKSIRENNLIELEKI